MSKPPSTYIHRFKQKVIDEIDLPTSFTFPFYYVPHPLAKIAADELSAFLEEHIGKFNYNFGLVPETKEEEVGKMFGVLVVKDTAGQLGYLRAFSGKVGETSNYQSFVPPIYDMLKNGSYFLSTMGTLNQLNEEVQSLLSDPHYLNLQKKRQHEYDIQEKIKAKLKARIKEGKKTRAQYRSLAVEVLNEEEYVELEQLLIKESLRNRFHFKNVQKHLEERLERLNEKIAQYETKIALLKERRKTLSIKTQEDLFNQYKILNAKGEVKTVKEIFDAFGIDPPAGSGECAAPKLLQFAYANNYTPICMAEFWWGKEPPGQVKHHKHFYPACKSKCEPILGHMLDGLKVEDNPLIQEKEDHRIIEILFEDHHLAVIIKPEEMLSVPGRHISDSVQTRMKKRFPEADGPLVVHRLDMSTSGLLLIAKSMSIYKELQHQFVKRIIKKRYIALLEGALTVGQKGYIDLPMRVDLENRPFQVVCHEHGKNARTYYEVLEVKEGISRVAFHPITGRTHQLRVHASYSKGLNTPIVGDDLYGQKGERLCLHAETLTFTHPITNEVLTFTNEAPF